MSDYEGNEQALTVSSNTGDHGRKRYNFGQEVVPLDISPLNDITDVKKLRPSMPELDNDTILYEIFPRLPVKSVHRFRCLSKAYRAITSDKTFLRNVSLYAPRRQLISIPQSLSPKIDVYYAKENVSDDGVRSIRLTSIDDRFIGGCIYITVINGIMCRVNESRNVILMNNATNEVQVLPSYKPPSRCEQHYLYFCYDPDTDIYKILRTMAFRKKPDLTTIRMRYSIFTLGSHIWTDFDYVELFQYGKSRSLCIDGILYLNKFCDVGGRHVIAMFSVQSNTLEAVCYPNGLDESRYDECHPVEVKGSLAIIDINFVREDGISMWLKQQGFDGSSWLKQKIEYPTGSIGSRISTNYYFTTNLNGDIVIGKTRAMSASLCSILMYNMDHQIWREMKVHGIRDCVVFSDIRFEEYFETPLLLEQICPPIFFLN
ncbi:hypothetical protein CASFOL_015898 [Castilleja foliolosa]|uniref:F-box associated beta-propeller type 3 domain-containing protein n=1 Tax=Castilleja foliolosa TaxID=1961234 RepID=A0ABD3DJ99_9LAMI